ncbi:MAG TPA: Ku protein [Gammaproteobacteria bacterium]|nr:Ku protein [Gammaproteobacteria bacterium]
MAARPYWSGQIRISLVTFDVTLRSAIRRGSQIPLHQIDRESGERIHHLNVTTSGKEVPYEDIVKSYDVGDDRDVLLEPDELKAIKLPSSNALDLGTFVDRSSIPVERFERPYFVLPGDKDAEEIYAVIHEALAESDRAGIGQITLRGREELCAVLAERGGIMLETLRYDRELVAPAEAFPDLSKRKLKSDYVDLANQLIEKNVTEPDFSVFHDRYHEALLELIKAKAAHRKPNLPKAPKQPEKVVDFMDALRRSLDKRGGASGARRHASHRAPPKRRASR